MACRTTARNAGVTEGVIFEIDDEDFADELARRIGDIGIRENPGPDCICSLPRYRVVPAFLRNELLNRKLFIGIVPERKRSVIERLILFFRR